METFTNILEALSIIALLSIVGILAYYLVRKFLFWLKWRNKNKKIKTIEANRNKVQGGEMIDDSTFKKASSKNDSFLDTNSLQRQKDLNFAYQNIEFRNEVVRDIYSGSKALNKFSGTKTILNFKNPKTSEKYPSNPKNDVTKEMVKTKDAKRYMQEHNIDYSYTKPISIIEMVLWAITLVVFACALIFSFSIAYLLIPYAIAIIMYGLRFLDLRVHVSKKNLEKISKSIFADIKTIERLDDFMDGFLTRNSHIIEDLKTALNE